jgi:hypothetical protein
MEKSYREQLNRERRNHSITQKITVKLSQRITDKMIRATRDKESWVWPFAFFLAVFNDGFDLLGIGAIPIIGSSIDLVCWIILQAFLFKIGGHLRIKIAAIIFIAGITETILGLTILPQFIPSWVLAVGWAYFKVKKRGELAERGLKEFQEGKLDREAVQVFR